MGRLRELEIPYRMPCLIAGLSLKLSFDPHFVSLPSCVAPARLVAGEWDVPLQSPQVGMQGVTPLGHAGLSCLSRGLALA